MVSQISGLSLENTSVADKILEAITTASDVIKAIRIEDLPRLWDSIVGALKDMGKALVNQIKDFFFKDLPGLIFDVGAIVANLIKQDYEKVLTGARSALNHFMNILEVLSLIPICSLICSILLAAIYFCQHDWFNAVCALI